MHGKFSIDFFNRQSSAYVFIKLHEVVSMASSKPTQITSQSTIDSLCMAKIVSSNKIVLPLLNDLISSVFKSKRNH